MTREFPSAKDQPKEEVSSEPAVESAPRVLGNAAMNQRAYAAVSTMVHLLHPAALGHELALAGRGSCRFQVDPLFLEKPTGKIIGTKDCPRADTVWDCDAQPLPL